MSTAEFNSGASRSSLGPNLTELDVSLKLKDCLMIRNVTRWPTLKMEDLNKFKRQQVSVNNIGAPEDANCAEIMPNSDLLVQF